MKRKTRKHDRFYIDDRKDMEEYEEIINDPLCVIISREKLMEKTIRTDNDGNTSTEIRPTYLVHWVIHDL